jgi:UDP-2,3-diacylglucosamine pyrophosphatase LpxH
MAKKKAYFLSDLHLFAKRSSAEVMEHAIHGAAQESQILVLGGDIFDFRWNRWSNHARTVQESISWLARLLQVNPDCQIHYLLGNHDASQAFVERLSELSQVYANLEWHPHLLRLHDCVFLHGDIIDARLPLEEDFHDRLDALRQRKEERAPPAKFQHTLYDAAVQARVHRLVAHVANPNARVLTRVTRYLDWAGYSPEVGIQNVFFGHTHRPLDRVLYSGMRFHNPGASIKGLDFRMLEIPIPSLPTPHSGVHWNRRGEKSE